MSDQTSQRTGNSVLTLRLHLRPPLSPPITPSFLFLPTEMNEDVNIYFPHSNFSRQRGRKKQKR